MCNVCMKCNVCTCIMCAVMCAVMCACKKWVELIRRATVHLHLVLLLSSAPCSVQSAATARWCAGARPWEKKTEGGVRLHVQQLRCGNLLSWILCPGQQENDLHILNL